MTLDSAASNLPDLEIEDKPRISKLKFRLSTDVQDAPKSQRVLLLRPADIPACAVIDCMPKDLADCKNGIGFYMWICSKKADILLSAPATDSGAVFDRWELIGEDLEPTDNPVVNFNLKGDVIVECYWVQGQGQEVTSVDFLESLRSAQLAELAEKYPGEKLPESLRLEIEARKSAGPKVEELPDLGQLIRVEARDDALIVGYVPLGEKADLLQEGPAEWQEVNYQGIAGWVKVS